MVFCYDDCMKKVQGKKVIAFPIQLFHEKGSVNFSELSDELHVVPTGKWDHPAYGEMEITTADIKEFIANFKAKVRRDIPITAGHDNGMSGGELPAIGWFKELYDRGVNGLYAVVEWTDEGKQYLSEGAFKYFSPEFYTDYEDPETRSKHGHVLVGGALTNKPYFKELDPVSLVASFSEPSIMNQFNDNNSMNIEDILKKDAKDVTAEEKTFLKSKESELTDEQKETAKDLLADEGGDEGGEGSGDDDDAGEGAGDDDDKGEDKEEGEKSASEKGKGGKKKIANEGKKIVMSEAEAMALRDAANNGQKAFDELEKMKLATSFDKLTFSETNKAGKFLSKQKDSVVSFMKSLSEKQRDQFTNIVNSMPKAADIFGEKGDGGSAGGSSDVAARVRTAAQEKVKASEGKMKYSDALKAVFSENPDLQKEYNESVEAGK